MRDIGYHEDEVPLIIEPGEEEEKDIVKVRNGVQQMMNNEPSPLRLNK